MKHAESHRSCLSPTKRNSTYDDISGSARRKIVQSAVESAVSLTLCRAPQQADQSEYVIDWQPGCFRDRRDAAGSCCIRTDARQWQDSARSRRKVRHLDGKLRVLQ